MYKALAIILFAIIGVACASHPSNTHRKQVQRLPSNWHQNKVGVDLCPSCINEVVGLINVVLNIILDEGIVSSCGALCGAVANKTGSTILGDLCDVACDGLGIDEFVKFLLKADIDPIYYCQLVDMCPIKDDGDAKFTNLSVLPRSAPEGTQFVLDLTFLTVNGTGTGTFTFDITDPKNETMSTLYWFEARKPGKYPERLAIVTSTLPNCNPATTICDAWPVGTYKVAAQICNGECGSHHPHTSIYDAGTTSFVITKKQ